MDFSQFLAPGILLSTATEPPEEAHASFRGSSAAGLL